MIQSPLDPVTTLAALAHATRWKAMELLAEASTLTAAQLANAVGMDIDGVAKHLLVLRRAGLVDAYAGSDARVTEYRLPEGVLLPDRVLDFGSITIRFSAPKITTLS